MPTNSARQPLALLLTLAPALVPPLVPSCANQEFDTAQEVRPRTYADNDAVRCAYRDSRGRRWFGTNNEGVWCLDGERFTRYSTKDGLSSDDVQAITGDDEGNLWFATSRGLTRFDGARFEQTAIPWDGNEDLWGPGLSANTVLCLLCDRRGDVWFGTWGSGVHRFDPSRPLEGGRYEFSSFLQDRGALYGEGEHRNVIQSIVEDEAGTVWLTSMSHGGITRYDGETFEAFAAGDELGDDMVFSACAARDGDLWFGMLGNSGVGLAHYDGEAFERFTTDDGLGSHNVVCIHEGLDGTLWFGSHRSELCRLVPDDEGGIRPFTVDGRTFANIHFVVESSTGGIWFGGGRGQLFHYEEGELTDHTQKG